MKLSFIFIYLSFIVSTKTKHNKNKKQSSEEDVPIVDTVLDLRGTVRRDFALEAALLDHARNMICSPLSILMPLGKLVLGSEGTAEKELFAAIGVENRKQLKPMFKKLISNMQYLPGVTLDVASRLYVATDQTLNKNFLRRTKSLFKSTCKKMNTKDPEATAASINNWVSMKTKQKIKNLVTPADISQGTSVLLVNAVYFAGLWKQKFEKVQTEDFHAPAGTRRIPMMTRQGQYNYWKCETLNAQLIEIPYEGDQSAMIIVLPFSSSGLPVLLRAIKLAPELLNQALDKMKTSSVILSMPKFKIESEFDLTPLYEKIGLSNIFDPAKSELTGIIDNKQKVFISKAVHKAIIEVNERGTEAAAATATIEATSSQFPKLPEEILVNHPYLFILRANHQILFMGVFNG
ncbi:unnamed protein product [Chrysodeixis includens]|uniref:Serpin domain-containing protein n=1 Tax=Chrysodeixis includens TaxID=689277 RepID=A0A9P0C2E5_CHRIL|nr:unnamed protein product [Chrysodeixis includens]